MSEVGTFCRINDVDGGILDLDALEYEKIVAALEAREVIGSKEVVRARMAGSNEEIAFPISVVRYVMMSSPAGRRAAYEREQAVEDESKEFEKPSWMEGL